MNIGDRVRLLHGKEEGVVKKFLENKLVEIEIEDGFVIPALRSELVVISVEEGRRFKAEEEDKTTKPSAPKVFATQGIFLAFTEDDKNDVLLHFINNTDYDLSYSITEQEKGNYNGVFNKITKSRSSDMIKHYYLPNLDKWPTFIFQILYFRTGNFKPEDPLVKKITFRASTFSKHKKDTSPVIKRACYLFQLDEEEMEFKPEKLKAALQENQLKPPAQEIKIIKPAREIDLHIEKLTDDFSKMSNSEILKLQLHTFENTLENAIASGMKEIVFIHGIGNGVLKESIHKVLGKHKDVGFFQDSQKERFGYGATLVTIK